MRGNDNTLLRILNEKPLHISLFSLVMWLYYGELNFIETWAIIFLFRLDFLCNSDLFHQYYFWLSDAVVISWKKKHTHSHNYNIRTGKSIWNLNPILSRPIFKKILLQCCHKFDGVSDWNNPFQKTIQWLTIQPVANSAKIISNLFVIEKSSVHSYFPIRNEMLMAAIPSLHTYVHIVIIFIIWESKENNKKWRKKENEFKFQVEFSVYDTS